MKKTIAFSNQYAKLFLAIQAASSILINSDISLGMYNTLDYIFPVCSAVYTQIKGTIYQFHMGCTTS